MNTIKRIMFAAAPSSSRWKTTSLPPANLTAAARATRRASPALVIGMTVDEAIRRPEGHSVPQRHELPDQLATALEEYKANHAA